MCRKEIIRKQCEKENIRKDKKETYKKVVILLKN